MPFRMKQGIFYLLVAVEVAGEFGAEKVIVQTFAWGNIPGIVTVIKQCRFMRIDGCLADTQFSSNLCWSESSRERLQYFLLGWSRSLLYVRATHFFLGLPLHSLCLSCAAERLRRIVDICAKRGEWTQQEFDASTTRYVHNSSFMRLLLDRVGCVEMPDMVMVIEVEGGNGDREQRHEATTTGDGKVDTILLSFQIPYESMNRVERSINMAILANIIQRRAIEFEYLRLKVHRAIGCCIIVACKLSMQKVKCMS